MAHMFFGSLTENQQVIQVARRLRGSGRTIPRTGWPTSSASNVEALATSTGAGLARRRAGVGQVASASTFEAL